MVNADTHELNKFGDLAHRWWDLEGEFKPLHQINPLRLEWMARHTSFAGARVLDVGCGGGILSEAMARLGAQVQGIDLSPKPLKVARLHAMESGVRNVEYREVAVETLAQEQPAAFDAVTCMEMLEHVPDPGSVVQACARLVKPGGKVFFSTLNRNLKSYALAIVGAEYLLKMLPQGTHESSKMIQPSELAGFARHAGLSVLGLQGLIYQPFTQRYALSSDTGVNYLMVCQTAA